MSTPERLLPLGEPNQVEVPEHRPVVRYPQPTDVRLPRKPATEIRHTGWLGGPDRQDVGHERRLRELHHLGQEAAYFHEMALAVELHGIKTASEAVSKAEEIVYNLPQDSVAAELAADMTGHMASRAHLRHARLTDTYDAEGLNIIRRQS